MNDATQHVVKKGLGFTRSVVWSVFITLAGVLLLASLRGGPMPTAAPPALVGIDLSGQPVDLRMLKGKPVVLYFWATWCGACKIASPVVDQFAGSHPDVAVIGVAMDEEPAVRAYLKEHDRSFRVMPATEDVQRAWPVRALPTTVVLNREGNIAWQRVGVPLPGELNFHVD